MIDNKYRSYIDSIEKDELKNQIIDLVKLFPNVREYYDLRIDPKLEKEMLARYKSTIKQEFFPEKKEVTMRYSVVSQAIIDFQRKALIPDNSVELMLYYVEISFDFVKSYGDIGEKFYISIEGTYDKALNYIFKNKLENKFHEKAKKILLKSEEIGTEFNENIKEIFYKYFDE